MAGERTKVPLWPCRGRLAGAIGPDRLRGEISGLRLGCWLEYERGTAGRPELPAGQPFVAGAKTIRRRRIRKGFFTAGATIAKWITGYGNSGREPVAWPAECQ